MNNDSISYVSCSHRMDNEHLSGLEVVYTYLVVFSSSLVLSKIKVTRTVLFLLHSFTNLDV